MPHRFEKKKNLLLLFLINIFPSWDHKNIKCFFVVVERRKDYGFANNSAEEWGECAFFESVFCPYEGIIPKAPALLGNSAMA